MNGRYDDIIGLPHHQSTKHPPLSHALRAAQFSPFAALSGYDKAIKETARLTTARKILDENAKEELDRKLRDFQSGTITYFKPDETKTGGLELKVTGTLTKLDENMHIVRIGETDIPIRDITDIARKVPEE